MIVKGGGYATECVIFSKTWFNIGKIIYLISKGSDEGYRLWLMYSQFDQKKYKEEHCYDLWSDFDVLMPEDYEEPEEPEDLPNGW